MCVCVCVCVCVSVCVSVCVCVQSGVEMSRGAESISGSNDYIYPQFGEMGKNSLLSLTGHRMPCYGISLIAGMSITMWPCIAPMPAFTDSKAPFNHRALRDTRKTLTSNSGQTVGRQSLLGRWWAPGRHLASIQDM